MLARLFFRWCWCIVGLLGWGTVTLSAQAQTGLQPVPALRAHVMDQTGTLDTLQQNALDEKLTAFEAAHGSQVVVLIVRSTAPEDIASYANRVGNAWKIGRKEMGDGVLLLVAKEDRKLRIEVAKALEGAVPDLSAKRVIDQTITPRFKQGDFSGGLDAGVDQLLKLIQHEALRTPAEEPEASASWGDVAIRIGWLYLPVLLFFAGVAGGAGVLMVVPAALGGALLGTLAWWWNANELLAFWSAIAGFVASLIGVFAWAASLGSSGKDGASAPASKAKSVSTGSSGTGADFSSSSDSGFFSSGGGGDFGGGGASGDW